MTDPEPARGAEGGGGAQTPREPLLAFVGSALLGGRVLWSPRRKSPAGRPTGAPAALLRSVQSRLRGCASLGRGEAGEQGAELGSGLKRRLRAGRGLFFLVSALADNATDLLLLVTTLSAVLAAVRLQAAVSLSGTLRADCPPSLVADYGCVAFDWEDANRTAALREEVLNRCSYALNDTVLRLRFARLLRPQEAAFGYVTATDGETWSDDEDEQDRLFAAANEDAGAVAAAACRIRPASRAPLAVPAACDSGETLSVDFPSADLRPSLAIAGLGFANADSSFLPRLFADSSLSPSVAATPYAPAWPRNATGPGPPPPNVSLLLGWGASGASQFHLSFLSGPRGGQRWACSPVFRDAAGDGLAADACTGLEVEGPEAGLCGLGSVPDWVAVCPPRGQSPPAPNRSWVAFDPVAPRQLSVSLFAPPVVATGRWAAPLTHVCVPPPAFAPEAVVDGSVLESDIGYSCGLCSLLEAWFQLWVLPVRAALDEPPNTISTLPILFLLAFNPPLLAAFLCLCAPQSEVNALFMMICYMAAQEALGLLVVLQTLCCRSGRPRGGGGKGGAAGGEGGDGDATPTLLTVFAKRSFTAALFLAAAYRLRPRRWAELDRRVVVERRAQLRAFRGGRCGVRADAATPARSRPSLFSRFLLFAHLVAETGQILFSSAVALAAVRAQGRAGAGAGTLHRAFGVLSLALSLVSLVRTAADWWASVQHRACCFGVCCGCFCCGSALCCQCVPCRTAGAHARARWRARRAHRHRPTGRTAGASGAASPAASPAALLLHTDEPDSTSVGGVSLAPQP